jgi:hypothetical protein
MMKLTISAAASRSSPAPASVNDFQVPKATGIRPTTVRAYLEAVTGAG